MSLSTSNSKNKKSNNWKGYWKNFLITASSCTFFIYLIIILVDPFDTIFFSPPLDRAPMATNQRFSYPAIARNQKFDSAIIGTSSVRLFNPEILNEKFSANFVNLAVNSATPYEQSRFLEYFLRFHPQPKIIIFGIDIKNQNKWCALDNSERFTEREFPEWIFDDNLWNDLLYHFNGKALEIAGRQVAQLTGFMKPRFGLDGFDNFTPDISEYDIDKARKNIYGASGKPSQKERPSNPELSSEEIENLQFPALEFFEEMLKSVPEDTTKIIHIPPRPWLSQPVSNTKDYLVLGECRARMINIAKGKPNLHIFDFSINSPITSEDGNFWDEWHHNILIAEKIIEMFSDKILKNIDNYGYFYYY